VVLITDTVEQHKSTKWLAIAHYRIDVCTRPTLIGAKHFNSAPTVTSPTHHYTGQTSHATWFSPSVFVIVLLTYFIWRRFDAFCYFFFTTCETFSIKNWVVLATGLARTWPVWSFASPFVIYTC